MVIAKKREKEQIEAEIKNIQSNAQLETTRLISLRDEAQQLTRQAEQVKIRAEKELEVVEDKIKLKTGELNNLTIESIQRLNSMGDYAIQIKNYEDSKNILLEEIVELKIYLETIRTDISKQKEELEWLSKDIIAIRKEKIQVSQMRALLDRKEDFIKEKFADAGLVYK